MLVASSASTSATISSLQPGTVITFTVRARDQAGNSSGASPSVTVTTTPLPDTTPPSDPTQITYSGVSTNSISLSWTGATDNVAVVSYEVYIGSTLYTTVTVPYITVSSLSAGTPYTFTIRARDAAGNRSSGSSVTVLTSPGNDVIAPSTPANLTWAADGGTVTLTWTPSTDNVAVAGYELFYGSFDLGFFSDTVLTLIGFKPGVPYNFTVKAKDAVGNTSAASNQTTVLLGNPVDTTPPSAPTNLSLTNATSSSLTVRWSASTDDVGVVIYQVLVNGNQVSMATGTSATITGLASGTVYGVSVRALDAAGNVSNPSSSLYVTTL
jgi:cellulose 1,4-beta-cellobiosidase